MENKAFKTPTRAERIAAVLRTLPERERPLQGVRSRIIYAGREVLELASMLTKSSSI